MKTPHLNLINEAHLYDFFSKKMAPFVTPVWFSFTFFLTTLFRIISRFLIRFPVDDSSQEKKVWAPPDVEHEHEHDHIVLEKVEEAPELEVIDYVASEYEGFEEKESDTPKFSFKFQFQPYEATTRSTADLTASASKYEFLTKKDCSGYVVEPEVVSFSIQELFINSSDGSVNNNEIIGDGVLSEKDFLQPNLGKQRGFGEIGSDFYSGEYFDKPESVVLIDNPLYEKEDSFTGTNLQEKEEFNDENRFVSKNEIVSLDYEPESICLWDKFSVMVNLMDSNGEEFLSDGDFDGGAQIKFPVELEERKTESMEAISNSERTHMEDLQDSEKLDLDLPRVLEENSVVSSPISVNMSKEEDLMVMDEVLEIIDDDLELKGLNLETDPEIEREYHELRDACKQEKSDKKGLEMDFEAAKALEEEGVDMSDPISIQNLRSHELADLVEALELELDDDIRENEQVNIQTSCNLESDPEIEKEFYEMKAKLENEDSSREGTQEPDNLEKSEEFGRKGASSDYDEPDSLETLWEHQETIELLKMELRKVRAIGLPTIYEESESPRLSEDLKPWKIDENFVHEEQINEHHKFYKGYRERMRKLDILNYQKMYAMGFYLQLKDPVKSISTKKSTVPTSASVLYQNFFSSKTRKLEANSSMKFMKEVESELELVYVGQLCLSWEFLHWQYGKAKELVLSDKYETRAYNQVAGEFQQFQVLMQRFLEKESFEGPRIPTYIKSRCDIRNLLEVPVIKEDSKDKEGRERSKADITCSMLLEIMEESMRIFWEFVRADRPDGNVLLKGFSEPQGKLLSTADTELWVDIQKDLQKKKKKLKDILRSGNCIVKKFQRHHKEEPDQLLFFSQVDLKLVARVLRMSRITSDQLGWCHEKLKRISFVNRKIHIEPSFLLFPC